MAETRVLKPTLSCSCKHWMKASCSPEFVSEISERPFCVLHHIIADPNHLTDQDKAKLEHFAVVVRRKVEEGNNLFQGVWFPTSIDFGLLAMDFRGKESTDRPDDVVLSNADFRGAVFSEAVFFRRVSFRGTTSFKGARFEGESTFDDARFKSENAADFEDCHFLGAASFQRVRFFSVTNFRHADFSDSAIFEQAYFSEQSNLADFSGATFSGTLNLARAGASCNVDFSHCNFHGNVVLNECTIASSLFFHYSVFDRLAQLTMSRATVENTVRFTGARLNGPVSLRFLDVKRGSLIDFSGTTIAESLKVYGGTWHGQKNSDRLVLRLGLKQLWSARIQPLLAFKQAGVKTSRFICRPLLALKERTIEVWLSLARHLPERLLPANNTQPISLKSEPELSSEPKPEFEPMGQLNFAHAVFEKPELITFQSVRLTPMWFMDVDVRKVSFKQVSWLNWNGGNWSVAREIEHLEQREREYESIAITYRQLAINAEDNHRYKEGSDFRYAAMDVSRLKPGEQYRIYRLHWWYWALSKYGEGIGRASAILMVLIVLFWGFYLYIPFQNTAPTSLQQTGSSVSQSAPSSMMMRPFQALEYSARVGALRDPTPHPLRDWEFVVFLESVLVPTQAALLLLAVRRRFSRAE